MIKIIMLVFALANFGCDEEEMYCHTTIDCSDDKESLCDEPSVYEYDDGERVEIRSCTYITYESCFEKTVCKPEGLLE